MASSRSKNPESIDALDIAMARSADSAEARSLIEKQSRLIDTQAELARTDMRHRGWQIIGERIGALLKGLTVAVGLLAIIGLTSFFWTAHKSSGMVMDPFSVPPTMASQGLSGAVVAQQLLDKIAALETQTQSARAASSYENSLSDSKGVVVPYAGVSLGEIRREARDWLGSENHVSGDVVQLSGGRVAINFRTLGQSGRVEGLEKDFDALLQEAALQVFKATQPYRYSVYQSRRSNGAEAKATLLALTKSPALRERLWAMHGLALGELNEARTVADYQRLLAIDPNFLPAIGNMPLYTANAGHDEEAYTLGQRAATAYASGAKDYTPDYADGFSLDQKSALASYQGDTWGAAKLARQAEAFGGGPVIESSRPFQTAWAFANAHDFGGVRQALAGAAQSELAQQANYQKWIGPQFDLPAFLAIATDDQTAIIAGIRRVIDRYGSAAALDDSVRERTDPEEAIKAYRPGLALALARTGQLAEARAAIAPLPADDDRGQRVRAFIAALSGDPQADALFAATAARTPSLPLADILWAEAKFARHDYSGAAAKAAAATRLGPNSAEAYRWWGKALMAGGKAGDAAAKFALAATNAPQWGALHLDWAGAQWQSGKRGAAVETLRAASNMALNPSDKARLMRMVNNANRQIMEMKK